MLYATQQPVNLCSACAYTRRQRQQNRLARGFWIWIGQRACDLYGTNEGQDFSWFPSEPFLACLSCSRSFFTVPHTFPQNSFGTVYCWLIDCVLLLLFPTPVAILPSLSLPLSPTLLAVPIEAVRSYRDRPPRMTPTAARATPAVAAATVQGLVQDQPAMDWIAFFAPTPHYWPSSSSSRSRFTLGRSRMASTWVASS